MTTTMVRDWKSSIVLLASLVAACGGNGPNGGAGGSGGTGGSGNASSSSSASSSSASSSSASSSSASSSSSSGGGVCSPGETMDCYTGPPETLGVGMCVGGKRTCADDGAGFGPCVGEIVPAPDSCGSPGDDDCNGSLACTVVPEWSKRFGGLGNSAAFSAATDASGNIVTAGSFSNTLDFGGVPLISAGSHDVFVAKVDTNGNPLWSKRFGDPNYQAANAVATDAAGNVVVAGYVQGTVDFGGGPLEAAMDGAIDDDLFVLALDANGNHRWSKRFGDVLPQSATAMAIDGAGNVYVTGYFDGTVNLGGGSPLVSAGNKDIFLVKLDSNGNHVWSKSYGDAAWQEAPSLAVNTAGEIALTGFFMGAIDFGGGPFTNPSALTHDVFVAKLDANGNHVWSKQYGGDSSNQRGLAVALSGAGNVFVTGNMEGTVDFGGGPIQSKPSDNTFLVGLDPNGNHLWSRRFGDAGDNEPFALVADAAGNVVLNGVFTGKIDFGGGAFITQGLENIFLAEFDASGNHVWSKPFIGALTTRARGMALDPMGRLVLAGGFASTMSFGLDPLVSVDLLDVCMAKLIP